MCPLVSFTTVGSVLLLFLRAGLGLPRFWPLLDYCFSTGEGAENMRARYFQLDRVAVYNYSTDTGLSFAGF